ncbi:MAG: ABC transporter substrate-binding protein [Spirochaetaceae bacterium]|nr:ABC transporter substrate-binding protein [Spirochaetaceae bacterium]
MTVFMNRLLAFGLIVAAPAMLMAGGESDSGGTSSSGAAAMAAPGQFSEAPMLAAMVAAGELPPLEERIAVEPVVQEMLGDGVGKYGGTLRVSDAVGAMNQRGHEMTNQEVDIYLLKMHQETREILPNIAKGYDVSGDGLTVTLELRPGTKWSNGDPFIVDDVMFVMEDLRWDDRVDPGWRPNETPPTATSVTKIDDYTLQFNLSARDHVIIPGWTTWKGGNYVQYAPSTHLKQWHIRYNPDAQKLAEEEGFETWAEALVAHWDIVVGVGLLETPTMFPWVPKEIGAQAEIWERNAYFWKVDPEGQQLPYIDRVLSTPNADVEVFNLKAIAGEVDWAIAQTNFASLPDYKENEDRGNYQITLIPGIDVGRAFGFNPTYKDEKYRALMQDVRFRRAMSVALDRDELNEVYFLGLGRPTAATIHSGARFYRPEWQTLWATYDPDLANQLLDEIGLDGRDRDGFRTFPDGSNLTIQVAARTGGSVDISKLFEIEIAQWGDVGLRVTPRLVDNAAWGENRDQDEFMLQPGTIDAITEFWNWINDGAGSGGVGLHGDFNMAGSYDIWETARVAVERGERKLEDYGGELPGTEPPEEWQRYFQWQRDFGLSEFGTPEWAEIAQKMYDWTGDNVFAIGTVGEAPAVLLTSKDLRNIPTEFPVSNTDWKGNLMYWADQLWFDRE